MESKKNPKVNLERKRGLFLQIGLVIALLIVLAAFEHKSYEKAVYNLGQLNLDDLEEEIIPITKQELKPPPPPPPPPAGTISLNNASYTVIEGEGVIATVARSGGSAGAVTIDYITSDGSANSGTDYTTSSGTLSWADGESGSKTVSISSLRDNDNENDETFRLSLSNATGGASTGTSSATITIQNVEPVGDISFGASSYAVTEAGQALVSVIRSNGSFGAVTVDYATADGSAVSGSDYVASSGTLSWADGESGSKTVSISSLSDIENETDETFQLSLSNASGNASIVTPSNATITIQNVETPGEISLDANSYTVTETGQVTASAIRSGGSFGAIAVDYTTSDGSAIAGNDYTASNGTLSWSDGEMGSKQIVVAILDDFAVEADETFSIKLSNLTGTAQLGTQVTATVSIVSTSLDLVEIPGLTPEQQKVAGAINDLCGNATGDLVVACQSIYSANLSPSELAEAMDSIKPSQVSSQGTVAIDFGFQQLKIIHGRIATLRGEKGKKKRISLEGLSVNSFGENIPLGRFAEAMMGASSDEPFRDSPLGFFIKGQINLGDKDSTNNEKGFNVHAESITLGVDYQFSDNLLVGMASGYGYSATDYDGGSGEMETHSGNFSLYGSYYLPKDFYIDWVLNYSINAYDSERNISFTGFESTANSNPFGGQYGGSFGFGKDFFVKNFFLSPYVRVEYLYTEIDDYNENGGGGFALHLDEQSIYSVATTLGGQISQSISMPWGIITPGARFEWLHQFEDDERNINTRFVNAAAGTGSFSVATDAPDRDYFNLGASLAITLPEGKSAFLRYESRLGQTDIISHTIEASVRIPF